MVTDATLNAQAHDGGANLIYLAHLAQKRATHPRISLARRRLQPITATPLSTSRPLTSSHDAGTLKHSSNLLLLDVRLSDNRYRATSPSAPSRSLRKRRSRTARSPSGFVSELATPSGTLFYSTHIQRYLNFRHDNEIMGCGLTVQSQIQRQATTLAQDPHRYLDDSPPSSLDSLPLYFNVKIITGNGFHNCGVCVRL